MDFAKLKTFADNKINLTEKFTLVLGLVNINIAEKGENVGYQNFLTFSKCFQNLCFAGLLELAVV